MRHLAADLDTGTTTLYRYVTGRDELLELMVDAVNGGTGSEGDLARPIADWRDGLRRVAEGARTRLLDHPWLASQLLTRPTIGPNTLRGAEFVISIAIGLTGDATSAAAITSTLLAFVLARRRPARESAFRTVFGLLIGSTLLLAVAWLAAAV